MKIITNRAVYIQVKDLWFMHCSLGKLPENLVKKYFGKNTNQIFDGLSEYDFIKVVNKEEKEYWKTNIFIPDYNEYSEKSVDDLILYGRGIAEQAEGIANHLCNPIRYEFLIDGVFEAVMDQYKYYNYLLSDVECMVAAKNGDLDLELPSNTPRQKMKKRKVSK